MWGLREGCGTGGSEHGLDVSAYHTGTLLTIIHTPPRSTPGPHMPPFVPGLPFQPPLPGASCPSPAGTRECTTQCLPLAPQGGELGDQGTVPGTLFFPVCSPTSHQPREAPDPGGGGGREGKGSSPGAWFSFSCPESEPLWETSEGY